MKKKCLFLIMALCITFTLLFSSDKKVSAASDSFYTNATAYGFNISTDYEPYYMDGFRSYSYLYIEKDSKGNNPRTQHKTTVVEVLLRNKIDPSIWCYAYRICASPLQNRYNGVFGIGSYGDNWYNRFIKTRVTFRASNYEIINYEPKNAPSQTTGSIGVGLDGSGPSISASVDFNHNDLTIESNTSSASLVYETIYKYNSHVGNTNSYLGGDVYAYGLYVFRKNGSAYIDVSHNIGYYGHVWYGYNSSTEACNVSFNQSYGYTVND